MIKIEQDKFIINTLHTSLIIGVFNGICQILYYGEKTSLFPKCNQVEETVNTSIKKMISSFGDVDFRQMMLLISNEDNVSTRRYRFVEADIITPVYLKNLPNSKLKAETLEIKYVDALNESEISQYISTFEDSDVLSFSLRIKNISRKNVYIKRALSFQLDLEETEYHKISLLGAWGRERHVQDQILSEGVFIQESICGSSSSYVNPFSIIFNDDNYYGVNLVYSSNHTEICQVNYNKSTRFLIGMNDFLQNKLLIPNEEFYTPEAIVCYGKSIENIQSIMNNFCLNHIFPKEDKRVRPVVFNSWEAISFNITKEKWIELAQIASSVGIEVFVFDDGWFGHRSDETSSLGDWVLNENKIGCNFDELKKILNRNNLKLGLWIEPEMVSPNSNLYRLHPNYTMEIPGVDPVLVRHQLMLDMTSKECVNYLKDTLSTLIVESKLDYIKWDFNRLMTDIYSYYNHQENYFYDYICGVYELMSYLKNRFPNVLFEGCASGGARFDLGILSYFPQIWISDNTDARERVYIQEGTYLAYHQSSVSCHVSESPNQQTGNRTSLEDRFNIAMNGILGYEMDLTKESESSINTIRKQIDFYHKHAELLQFGKLSVIKKENCHVWKIEQNDEVIVTLIYLEIPNNNLFSFKDIICDGYYYVEQRKQDNLSFCINSVYSSDVLIKGIRIEELFDELDRKENEGSISTRVFYLKKVGGM